MYLNQKGLAQQKLAEMLIASRKGERIPTFSELQKQFHVGAGTLTAAIREFENNKIIKLQTKQRMGMILAEKDVGRLWRYTSKGYITGLFPEPLSLEMRGLAMGLREAFRALDIPLVIVYGYGSRVRFDRILNDSSGDFVISSMESVRQRLEEDDALSVVHRFGRNSFYVSDSLLILENASAPKAESRVVGIDRNSYDHMRLTQQCYPGAQFKEVRYAEIPFDILAGEIDCAVWHQTAPVRFPENLIHVSKYSDAVRNFDLEGICEAVLSIHSGNQLMEGVLSSIDVKKVTDVQRQVLNHEIEPVF